MMMKLSRNFRTLMMVLTVGAVTLFVSSCGNDDDPSPAPILDGPGITVNTDVLQLDAGGTLNIEFAVSIPGGYASEEAVVVAGEGSVTVGQTLAEGDTTGVIVVAYTTDSPGQANIQLTVTDGQADPKTVSATAQVTAFAPLADEYPNLMAMVNSRPEFTEIAALISLAGRAEAFLVEGNEGAQYGTFFVPTNGALDAYIAMSPFLNSVSDIDEQLAGEIVNLFFTSRMRFRGIATPFGGEYRGLYAADLQPGATLTNDSGEETGINRGGQMNNRNYASIGFSMTGTGYMIPGEEGSTYQEFAGFVANDIEINVVTAEVEGKGEVTKAGIVAHVIDKAWFDFSVLENFPSTQALTVNPNFARSEVTPRVLGWSNTAWWALNSLNGVGTFSGSRSNNGILFIPMDAVDAINSKLPTTNLSSINPDGSRLVWGFPAGPQDPVNDPNCDACPSWYPRPDCGCYIPADDFAAGQEYWFKHSIQMTDPLALQNGAIGGSFTNIAGDNVTIDLSAGTVTMGSVTANVLATIAWNDNSGRYIPLDTDDTDFIAAVAEQEALYRVIHILDVSLY